MKQFYQQQQQDDESEINITPMLDVVFIMLIFFIVTATFIKEAGIDVNRPDAPTAVKQAIKANPTRSNCARLATSAPVSAKTRTEA